MNQLEDAEKSGFESILFSNRKWWNSFWDKSYVILHSSDVEADFIEKNYNYFMYVMASSSRGNFPPKFNGMIWTTGGDARKWGNNYWGANQSCMYNGLFPAWPTDWDAEFKLLCRGNFILTASFNGGILQKVEILSQSGSDCSLVNPWPGKKVMILNNGKKKEIKTGKILKFSTNTNETISLLPK